jgi:hypothetical protein
MSRWSTPIMSGAVNHKEPPHDPSPQDRRPSASPRRLLVLAACGDDEDEPPPRPRRPPRRRRHHPAVTDEPAAAGDIVAVASANPDFSTLVAAVQAAGLVETLQGPGPFTVFAPTNDAFAALPAGLVDKLLLPENKDALTQILTYHVVAGKVMAADVAGRRRADGRGSTSPSPPTAA